MEKAIHQYGWDGEWSVRGYDDFAKPNGPKACQEGKIFIGSQGICALAGIGLEDRNAKLALYYFTCPSYQFSRGDPLAFHVGMAY